MKKLYCFMVVLFFFINGQAYSQKINFNEVYTIGGFHNETVEKMLIDDNNNVILMGSFYGTIEHELGFIKSKGGYKDIFLLKVSPEGSLLWAINVGTKLNERYNANSDLALDNQGNIILATTFVDTLFFGEDTLFSFRQNNCLLKFDPNGQPLWSKQIETSKEIYYTPRHITVDREDNIYFGSGFNSVMDIDTLRLTNYPALFLAKFDKSGRFLWLNSYQTSSSSVYIKDLEYDGNNHLFFLCEMQGDATFESTQLNRKGVFDLVWGKVDTSGNLIFVKQESVEGDNWAFPKALHITSENNIAMTGEFRGVISLDGSETPGYGYFNIFTAVFNSSGSLLWKDVMVASDRVHSYDICSNSQNQIIITGSFKDKLVHNETLVEGIGDEDIFIAMYDNLGDLLVLENSGGSLRDFGVSLAQGVTGLNYLAGAYTYKSNFDQLSVDGYGNLDAFYTSFSYDPTSVNSKNSTKKSYSTLLRQNSPNPFNPITFISFELPSKQEISLKIYDVTGQLVSKIYEGIMEAGKHTFSFNGNNLSSGTYVYQLQTREGVYSKRMLLIK